MKVIQGGLNEKKQAKERGIMMAMAALGFVAFMLAAGLAVDVSRFYLAGAELQNAADAAAIAGASSLNSTKNGLDAAVARATVAMNKYNFNVANAAITAANVRFARNLSEFNNGANGIDLAAAKANPTKVRFLKVQVTPASIGVAFSHLIFSGGAVTLTRSAVAGQSTSGSNPDTPDDPGPNCVGNPSAIVLLEDDQSNGQLQLAPNTSCANTTVYTKGCTYDVNMTPPCDFPASVYEIGDRKESETANPISSRQQQIVAGLRGDYCYNERVWVWTHPTTTTMRNALNTLFNSYAGEIPSSQAGNFPPDTNIRENITFAQYKDAVSGNATFASPSRTGVAGRRILIMPIMKRSSGWIDPTDPTYERAKMTFYKYGAFFLVKRPNSAGQLRLEYISDRVSVGSASLDPSKPMPTSGSLASSKAVSPGVSVPVLYR